MGARGDVWKPGIVLDPKALQLRIDSGNAEALLFQFETLQTLQTHLRHPAFRWYLHANGYGLCLPKYPAA
jgi:hypothetical protein